MLDGFVLLASEYFECLLGALPIITAGQRLKQRTLNVVAEVHGWVLPPTA
jgi:hypothetical protein